MSASETSTTVAASRRPVEANVRKAVIRVRTSESWKYRSAAREPAAPFPASSRPILFGTSTFTLLLVQWPGAPRRCRSLDEVIGRGLRAWEEHVQWPA